MLIRKLEAVFIVCVFVFSAFTAVFLFLPHQQSSSIVQSKSPPYSTVNGSKTQSMATGADGTVGSLNTLSSNASNQQFVLNWVNRVAGISNSSIHNSPGETVALSQNQAYVAAASANGNISLYSISGRLLWNFSTGEHVVSLAISSNGSYVAAAAGGSIYTIGTNGSLMWDYTITGYVAGGTTLSVVISPNNRFIAASAVGPSGDPTGDVYLFYSSNGTMVWQNDFGGSFVVIYQMAVSFNQTSIFAVSGNGYASGGTVFDFNFSSGNVIWSYGLGSVGKHLSLDQNGNYIAVGTTGYGSGTLLLFRSNGSLLWTVTTYNVASVGLSGNGSFLAAEAGNQTMLYSSNGTLLWNQTISSPSASSIPGDAGNSLAVSQNATSIIVSSLSSGTVYEFNRDGNLVWSYTFGSYVNATFMTQDGAFMLVGTNTSLYLFSSSGIKSYNITFTESGLPSGTTWSVTFNGMTELTTSNSIAFTVPNGTYQFSIGYVSGFFASPNSGTMIINGASTSETIVFSSSSEANYVIDLNVSYSGSVDALLLNVNKSEVQNALSLKNLPAQLSLYNISLFLYDYMRDPSQYPIYNVSIVNSQNQTIGNISERESMVYNTLLWSVSYQSLNFLKFTYGQNSGSYLNLTVLEQGQGAQELGIDVSSFLSYATLVGPLLSAVSSYFGGNSAESIVANSFINLVYHLLKGYQSVESKYGVQAATSIVNTLAQYGIVSSSNLQAFNPSQFIVNLAELNPTQYSSLITSVAYDIGIQSSQLSPSLMNFASDLLKNLGQNFLSAGFSAAGTSAITFLNAYFNFGMSVDWASGAATSSALESLSSSVSDFFAFLLPLSIANAIYSSYLQPMSAYLSQEVNLQNMMYNVLYPVMFSGLQNFVESGNVANITDGAAVTYETGLLNAAWYSWFNASTQELKGEFLNSNANYQISINNELSSAIQANLQALFEDFTNTSNIANSLSNGATASVSVSGYFGNSELIPAFTFDASAVADAFTSLWNSFTSSLNLAAEYVQQGWSSLTSGISRLSSFFSNLNLFSDPPAINISIDSFTLFESGSRFISTYPMASMIFESNSTSVILPGNLSGYLLVQSNISSGFRLIGYNSSEPQNSLTLASSILKANDVNIYYVNSTNSSKHISQAAYSILLTEKGLSGKQWSVIVTNTKDSMNGTFGSNGGTILINGTPNGSYEMNYLQVKGYLNSPSVSTVVINGSSASETEIYSKLFNVTFSESGLPHGTNWSVTLNGVPHSSTDSVITFAEPNGTYSFAIVAVTGYNSSITSGSIIVNGSSATKVVNFTLIPTSHKSPPGGSSTPAFMYEIIGAGAIVTALVAIMAISISRRRKK